MKIVRLFLLIISFTTLNSCWDANELEEFAYIVAIGFDKGENGMINVTYQIANPQVGSSDIAKAEKEPSDSVITILAPDIVVARDMVNISVSRTVTFSHLKIIIISEEFAMEGGLFKHVDTFVRDPQIQTNISVLVSKEKAADFIKKNKPPLETRPHKNYVLLTERWRDTGLVPESTIERFLQRTEGDVGAFLAIYATAEEVQPNADGLEDQYIAGEVKKEGDNKVEMIGAAVFKEGKMIGKLTGEEVRITLTLRKYARAKKWVASFKDPLEENNHISARVFRRNQPKVNININGENTAINIDVNLEMFIQFIKSNTNYITDPEKQTLLKNNLEEALEEKTQKLIKKSQEEFKIDLFQLDQSIRKKFWTIKEFEEYGWMKKFPEMEIEVNFNVNITQFGRQFPPVNEEKVKD